MTDPEELRQRAAMLRAKAQALAGDADRDSITAELMIARAEAERAVTDEAAGYAEASRKMDAAQAVKINACDEVQHIQASIRGARAALRSTAVADRVTARTLTAALGDELKDSEETLAQARAAAASATAEVQQTRRGTERAEAQLAAIGDALADPLHHPRAKETAAYMLRVMRGGIWADIICGNVTADAKDGEIARHRLAGVLAQSGEGRRLQQQAVMATREAIMRKSADVWLVDGTRVALLDVATGRGAGR